MEVVSLLLVVLIFGVNFMYSLNSDESRTFGLQTGLNQPGTTESYLRYDFGQEAASQTSDRFIQNFTVCYRFWIQQYRDVVPFVSYAFSDKADNAILLFQARDHLEFYYNDEKESPNTVVDDTLEVWHHHCYVFSHPRYSIFVDGALKAEGVLGSTSGQLPLNGTLYVGQEQDRYNGGLDKDQSFSGFIAQINIWSSILNSSEIQGMASCNINLKGDIFASDNFDLEEALAKSHTSSHKVFCQKSNRFVIIPEKMLPSEAEKFCSLTDSKFYIPESKEDNSKLFNDSRPFNETCNGKTYRLMFLGATDEVTENTWIKKSDDTPLDYSAWAPGEPNGGSKRNCLVLRRQDGQWSDVDCNDELCFPCGRSHQDFLQVRGLCLRNEHSTRMVLDGYLNGKPFFRGYYRFLIQYSGDKEWLLKDMNDNITLAILKVFKESEYPIGRQSWIVMNQFCEHLVGMTLTLGLSKCTTQQFMCSDGSCVPRGVRCDLRDDCLDGSDEQGCSIVDFSPQYHNHRPPPGLSLNKPLPIIPVIGLIRFSKIDDINLAFHIEIEIAMIWKDSNLKFKNIKEQEGKNKLTHEEVTKIWTPEVEFLNVNDGNLQKLKSGVYVKMVGEADPPLYNDVKMETIYQPESGQLVKRTQYYASFNCHFSLFRYPFDTQTCAIIIKLSSADRKVIDFQNASVIYSGPEELPKYEIQNVNVLMKPRSGYAVLEVLFDLERRWSLLMLTVFVPTFLLLGIGYGTLYIRLQAFQVRAIMTLTTLLVLYTMFNQVSSALPDTAYIKMVDMWFFFCIFLIFTVIIIHILVERLEPGEELKQSANKVSNVKPVRAFESSNSFWNRLTATRVMSLARRIVFPITVSLFGAFFWLALLAF